MHCMPEGTYLLIDAKGKLLLHNVPPNHLKLVAPAGELAHAYKVEAIINH